MDCILRSVFENLSNIYGGAFCENSSTMNHWQNLKEVSDSHQAFNKIEQCKKRLSAVNYPVGMIEIYILPPCIY